MATNPTGGPTSLVERVKNILMQPKAEWPRIDAEPATIGAIYRNYVMILAAIPPLAGAIGLLLFGFSMLGISYRPSPGFVIGSAIIQYILALVGLYVLALIVEALAPTFGGVKDRVKAFKVCAYASTAGWVAGIFGLIPQLAWLALIGGLYGLYLLYLGLPVLMKVSADKAIGYILAIVVAAIIIYLVVGMIAASLIGAFLGVPGPAAGTITIGVTG